MKESGIVSKKYFGHLASFREKRGNLSNFISYIKLMNSLILK